MEAREGFYMIRITEFSPDYETLEHLLFNDERASVKTTIKLIRAVNATLHDPMLVRELQEEDGYELIFQEKTVYAIERDLESFLHQPLNDDHM